MYTSSLEFENHINQLASRLFEQYDTSICTVVLKHIDKCVKNVKNALCHYW
jgi:hypothetical protein